uniref:Cyclin N-terminal domain-containing protein n=1 Tax=Taeniopygia guttata TaxID=59729 RepID=A0A674GP10_TAEGU
MTSPPRALTSRGPPEPGGAEARARFRTARFIMEAGVKLGLGSAALATACSSFHALAAVAPALAQERFLVAAAALFVAAKAQGTPRRARDVLNVTLRCLHPGSPPPALDGNFWGLRDSLVQCELLLLRALRFRLPLAHPHKVLSPGLTPAALEGIERELLGLYSLDTQVGGGAATPAPPPPPPLPAPPPPPPRRPPARQTEPPPHKRTDRRSPPCPPHGHRDPPPNPDRARDPPPKLNNPPQVLTEPETPPKIK